MPVIVVDRFGSAIPMPMHRDRNRHCPKCQGLAQQRWVDAREADLLPVPYYHLVFTLPDLLNGLCISSPEALYNLLFQCSWQTVQTFAAEHKYLGAHTGMVSVLHTWGQTLSLHPHVHAIVPGGGLTPQGKWRMAKGKGKFLFPVKAMSQVFRGKVVAGLKELPNKGFLAYLGQAEVLPHQWAHLASNSPSPDKYSYQSVRGELKCLEGNSFSTENRFYGILPTLPFLDCYNPDFSPSELYSKVQALKGDGLDTWTDSYTKGSL